MPSLSERIEKCLSPEEARMILGIVPFDKQHPLYHREEARPVRETELALDVDPLTLLDTSRMTAGSDGAVMAFSALIDAARNVAGGRAQRA